MKTQKQIDQITENVLQNLIDFTRKKYKRATSSRTGEGIRFRDTNINLSTKAKAFALLVNKIANELGLKTPIITSALRTAESQANAMFDIWTRQGKENGGTEYIKKLYGEMCKSCSPNSKEIAEKLTKIWQEETKNKTSREEIIKKTRDILAAEEISMHQSGNALDYGTTINSDKDVQKIINKINNEKYATFELIDERVPDENGILGNGSGSHWHISVNSITPKGLDYLKASSFLSEQIRRKFEINLPVDLETLSDNFKRSGKELDLAITKKEKENFEKLISENKKNLEKILEDISIVDEMAIKQFKTVGDWNRRSSFGDVDRKILTSPRGVEKIKRQWEKTPIDFDMYLVNDPRVNKPEFREKGEVDLSFVRDKMKLTADEIPDPDQNKITIIYTSNTGAQRYMATGWTLAHRLGHALARGDGDAAEKWKNFRKTLRKYFADILKKVYEINVDEKIYDFAGNADKDKILKYVAQELGTMKSARDNKMRNWYEFAYELLAQYLLTGKITFNPLPLSIHTGVAPYGREQTRYSRDEEAREAINTEELESIASEIQGDLNTILAASVGKVFVM